MQCLETGPYRDHIINVIITFDEYPYQSPTVKFINHIYHPNIDFKTGTIINQYHVIIITINLTTKVYYALMVNGVQCMILGHYY